jgi:hypothetical protein
MQDGMPPTSVVLRPRTPATRVLAHLCAVLSLALLAAALLVPAAHAATPVRVSANPADRLANQPLDAERYDRSRRCTSRPRAGTLALQAWLQRNARGVSWGIMRCEKLGPRNFSLHADGRALDWHLDVTDPADRRVAQRLIALMLAPDRLGQPHALARRMGLQEIIWDCMSWWAGTEGLRAYSVCLNGNGDLRRHVDPTLAHRNHIHFGLSFAGAAMRTSFWRR